MKTLTQNDMSSNWSNSGANKLIEVKNRGGLLTSSNIMVTFFVKLEKLFRHLFLLESSISLSDTKFKKAALTAKDITAI